MVRLFIQSYVIVLAKDENNKVSVTEQKLAGVAAAFLGRQMES